MARWHLRGPAWTDTTAADAAAAQAAKESRRHWAAHRARIRQVDPTLRQRMLDALTDVVNQRGYIDITADTTRDIRDLADDLAEAWKRLG